VLTAVAVPRLCGAKDDKSVVSFVAVERGIDAHPQLVSLRGQI
jgi:hypothetical protein